MLKKHLYSFIKISSCILLIGMVVSTLLQIFFRHVLRISVPWTEEGARIFAIWLTFIGIAAIEAENTQVRTEYFVSKMSPRLQKGWKLVIVMLSSAFLLCFLLGSIIMFDEASAIMLGVVPGLTRSILFIPAIIGTPIMLFFIWNQFKEFKRFD